MGKEWDRGPEGGCLCETLVAGRGFNGRLDWGHGTGL